MRATTNNRHPYKATGISRVAYRNLEKGDANPRKGTLQALADALKVSIFDLLAPLPQLKSLRFRANKTLTEQERAQSDLIVTRTGNWLQDFNEVEEMLNHKNSVKLKRAPKGTKPEKAAAQLRKQFIKEWNENRGLLWVDAVLKTKRHFKVSYQSVIHQLIDLGQAKHPDGYKDFRTGYEERYGKKLHWKEEPRPLDTFDLIEDHFSTLVRDALDNELISISRAAEILNIRIEEMRERLKSWEVVS